MSFGHLQLPNTCTSLCHIDIRNIYFEILYSVYTRLRILPLYRYNRLLRDVGVIGANRPLPATPGPSAYSSGYAST